MVQLLKGAATFFALASATSATSAASAARASDESFPSSPTVINSYPQLIQENFSTTPLQSRRVVQGLLENQTTTSPSPSPSANTTTTGGDLTTTHPQMMTPITPSPGGTDTLPTRTPAPAPTLTNPDGNAGCKLNIHEAIGVATVSALAGAVIGIYGYKKCSERDPVTGQVGLDALAARAQVELGALAARAQVALGALGARAEVELDAPAARADVEDPVPVVLNDPGSVSQSELELDDLSRSSQGLDASARDDSEIV
jgi:hypothetical protein